MGFSDVFKFGLGRQTGKVTTANIFPLSLVKADFIRSDILHTYTKILTDTMERTHGLSKKLYPTLWDNCVQTEASLGVISLLAEAMTDRRDLYLVFIPSAPLVRKATPSEEAQIKDAVKAKKELKNMVHISFTKYEKTTLLRIYSEFEYCILGSLNKTLNLSKAIQIKVNDLRASTALADSAVAVNQAQEIAKGLSDGDDVLIDAKDAIETANPDTASSEKGIAFLNGKRAHILGLPLSYVNGELVGGLNNTGGTDAKAVDRGLKPFFLSILQPVFKSLFNEETEYKPEDTLQISTALEVLKTMDLTTDDNLSRETKREVVAISFNRNPEEELKRIEAEEEEREARREEEAEALQNQPEQDPNFRRNNPFGNTEG